MSHLRRLFLTINALTLTAAVVPSIGINDLKYVFFESSRSYVAINFEQTGQVIANPKYDITLPNIVYVHDYRDSPHSDTSRLVTDAYLKLGGFNVFALDWSTLASGSYLSAVANANEAGKKLGLSYIFLYTQGITPNNTQLTGFGVGAHLAGHAGRTIIDGSNGVYKLERLTGLDPANDLYYPPVAGAPHINRNDAAYVDIIHTDAGGYGTSRITGTADFFVNMGGRRFQPGCRAGIFIIGSDNDLCSHRRSVQLWAESVSDPSSTFTATMFGNRAVTTRMGQFSPKTTEPGKYTLKTNSASPFSKG